MEKKGAKQQTIDSYFKQSSKNSQKQSSHLNDQDHEMIDQNQIDYNIVFSKQTDIEEEKNKFDDQNKQNANSFYIDDLQKQGYAFYGADQQLLNIETKMPYQFKDKDAYDTLCSNVIKNVQQQMIQKYGMIEVLIPENKKSKAKSNIFHSQDFYSNKDKCLILIQGTGAVRAGIWSRRVCINYNLKLGSMLPIIEYAQTNGYSVIVFNPNLSKDEETNESIPYCETMSSHCLYVWENYILNCPAKVLSIVAHSAGGRCVADIFMKHKKIFLQKVKALVFTDAFYHAMFQDANNKEKQALQKIGIHFKKYTKVHKNVGEQFKTQNGPILEVSAGTSEHELTTGVSLESIIAFIKSKNK